MSKLYTGCGDYGKTSIFHCNIDKDSPLIEVIGTIDELQSSLDIARLNSSFNIIIEKIQDKLRFLAGEVAGYVDATHELISLEDIHHIETIIDELSDVVPSTFVRFNNQTSVYLNESRVRARRLERKIFKLGTLRPEVGKYVNRLSDLFFVLSYKAELELTD